MRIHDPMLATLFLLVLGRTLEEDLSGVEAAFPPVSPFDYGFGPILEKIGARAMVINRDRPSIVTDIKLKEKFLCIPCNRLADHGPRGSDDAIRWALGKQLCPVL